MAEVTITVNERPQSRSGDLSYEERIYVIDGTEDKNAARTALLAATPATVQNEAGVNLVRDSDKVVVENFSEVTDAWESTVQWKRADLINPGTGVGSVPGARSFDTTGGIQHRLLSLDTVVCKSVDLFGGSVSSTTSPFNNLIGANEDGSASGTDIVSPIFTWEETREIADANMTTAYARLLFDLTGTVNSAPYREFEAGENLFLGAIGSQRGTSWIITFRHAASPNKTNLSVGNVTGINKKGWEYLWVHYQKHENTTEKFVAPTPKYVLVERVYPTANHNQLDT